MKKLLSLISLLLVLSMLLSALVGCKKDPDVTPDNGEDPATTPEEDTGPYTSTENYIPEAVFKQMKNSFEGGEKNAFIPFSDTANADDEKLTGFRVVSLDVATISNCAVKSINIPVIQTLDVDAEGNFIFTLSTYNSSLEGLGSDPLSTYKIKISAADNKLTANDNPYRYVEVDLSAYNIELGPGETLAFGDPTDTVIAAHIQCNKATNIKY